MADERVARRGVLDLAEQLLELVDDQEQPLRGGFGGEGWPTAAAGSSGAPPRTRARSSSRSRAGAEAQDAPGAAGEIAGVLELRQQAGTYQRRLARARRADDGEKVVLANERQEFLDLDVAAVEEAGVLLAERDHAGIRAGDGFDRGLGCVEVASEPGGLVVPAGPVGAVERLAEAEPQGGLAGVQGQGQQAVAALVDRGECDEPFAELGPAIGQEGGAEHEQGESAGRHPTLELVRDELAQAEVARREHAGRLQAQHGLEIAVDPGAVDFGMDDEKIELRWIGRTAGLKSGRRRAHDRPLGAVFAAWI